MKKKGEQWRIECQSRGVWLSGTAGCLLVTCTRSLIGLLMLAMALPAGAQMSGGRRVQDNPQRAASALNASSAILSASPFRGKLNLEALTEIFRVLPQVINPDGKAVTTDWPYTVAIGVADGAGFRSFCGGVAIAPRRVLTAAHCAKHVVRGATKVYWGGVDLRQIKPAQLATVSDLFLHPDYSNPDQTNFEYDVAVLALATPMKVPTASLGGDVAAGQELVVMGWGSTTPTGGGGNYTPSASLLFAKVNAIPLAACVDAYRKGLNAQVVTERMFCAAAPGKDSCTGDSGGPIVRRTASGAWQVVGLVSFGESCALKDYPGVYAYVSKFRDWLSQFAGDSLFAAPRAGATIVR